MTEIDTAAMRLEYGITEENRERLNEVVDDIAGLCDALDAMEAERSDLLEQLDDVLAAGVRYAARAEKAEGQVARGRALRDSMLKGAREYDAVAFRGGSKRAATLREFAGHITNALDGIK